MNARFTPLRLRSKLIVERRDPGSRKHPVISASPSKEAGPKRKLEQRRPSWARRLPIAATAPVGRLTPLGPAWDLVDDNADYSLRDTIASCPHGLEIGYLSPPPLRN